MNGLPRHGKKGAIQWRMMQSQGVIKHEADICIALPRGKFGAFLAEHKGEGQPHKLSEEQFEYLEYHLDNGNLAVSTRGLNMLQTAVTHYMELEA